MLCPKCGYYDESEENVCPSCGNIISLSAGKPVQGAQAIRQGKRAREIARSRPAQKTRTDEEMKRRSGASHATIEMPSVKDERFAGNDYFDAMTVSEDDGYGPSFERRRRTFYDEGTDAEQAARYAAFQQNEHYMRRRMINWIKVGIVIAGAFILIVLGIIGFLKFTSAGQMIVTRTAFRFPSLPLEVNSASLWTLGEEFFDKGEIQKAIECFEKAKQMNEEEKVTNVDGLLRLGSAYEAAGMIDEAAALYEAIYTETPTRSEAYKAHIRLLQSSQKEGDLTKAGNLMKLAYENTHETVFQNQRNDFLPKPPEVNLTAAYYEKKEHITLTSYQGFDIYFTFQDDAVLPHDGMKFKEPILLDEGTYHLRAVCVNGELVSDELTGTYRISMPRPMMPQCNLAPNTYKTKKTVKLKPGKDNVNDDDIRIYYTIDGSPPDLDSPLYKTGEQIKLPTGWVILRAIAVNQYQKLSNELKVKYYIDANPKPNTVFTNEDTLDSIKFGTMTQLEFFETYGEGTLAGVVETDEYETECRKYEYSWGYAIMNLSRKTWVVVEVSCTTGKFNAPRKTAIGDEEEYVTGQFRDMGQVESAKGNRGLYYNDKGSGKVWKMDDKTKVIRYIYATENHEWQLEYHLKNNSVVRIDMKYVP